MAEFIHPDFGHHTGDPMPDGQSVEVPPRPDPWATWDGAAWQPGTAPTAADEAAAELNRPALRGLVRVLSNRFGITEAQVRDAIKAGAEP